MIACGRRLLLALFLLSAFHSARGLDDENDANFTNDGGGGERDGRADAEAEAPAGGEEDDQRSPVDCDFDERLGMGGMCSWRPDVEGRSLWHSGNAALVDSVNSIVKPGMGEDRFAFVSGHVGTPSEGSLESQILRNAPGITNQLQFSYWKAAFGPILDVCLKKVVDSKLDCIDSITGMGAQKWTRRTLVLPRSNEPFRIVFRARNIHSAEDLIGVDDIRLRMTEDAAAPPASNDVAESETKHDARAYGSPILLSGFEMRRAQPSAVIQPATSGSSKGRSGQPIAMVDEEKLPVQDESPFPSIVRPATLATRPQTTTPSSTTAEPPSILFHHHSPIPNARKMEATFPDFPSFDNEITGGAPIQVKSTKLVEETESCKAVKCSFLETTCLWHLGKGWKLGDGNIAVDQDGEDVAKSGFFKAPFATFFEFDLWMSDDALLSIVQETRELGQPGADELSLFERRGQAAHGWHRFRVPLRPAFNPIRLLIRATLPTGSHAFATISNTRLVNAGGDEVRCETTPSPAILLPPAMPAPAGPPSWAGGVPLMNGILQTNGMGGGLTTMNAADSTIPPMVPAPSPLAPLLSSPFSMPAMDAAVHQQPSGMMEGVTPIVPMRDTNTQRLTAFQKLPAPFSFPTLPPLPSLFETPTPSHMSYGVVPSVPIARPTANPIGAFEQSPAAPADPFGNTDADLMLSPTPAPVTNAVEEEESADGENNSVGRDQTNHLGQPQSARDLADRSAVDRLMTAIAGQPLLEQQLRQFAKQVGFDASRVPDRAALAAQLRRFFGPRATAILDATAGRQLPLSVASAAQTHRQSGDTEDPSAGAAEMRPIRPANVNEDDFQRAVAQDAMKKAGFGDANGEMLRRLTAFLTPQTPADQSPLVREHLDFGFQNAMNG